jgi:hypothetical protein
MFAAIRDVLMLVRTLPWRREHTPHYAELHTP